MDHVQIFWQELWPMGRPKQGKLMNEEVVEEVKCYKTDHNSHLPSAPVRGRVGVWGGWGEVEEWSEIRPRKKVGETVVFSFLFISGYLINWQ